MDAIGDRLMFRLAYRNFGDHESLVGNFTVRSNGVAGIRWFELRGVTSGPGDDLPGQAPISRTPHWRWMGSVAMDKYKATWPSASAPPVRRSTRRSATPAASATDPINTMTQGEGSYL